MVAPVPFRFDADEHEYVNIATGQVIPHITGMLAKTGWIDDRWYTEESSERGQAVHRLTADYDLGALDLASCVSRHRGYLLGHVACMKALRPTIEAVEEPIVHPTLGFGGRPDRRLVVHGVRTILEIKSGGPEKSHQVQTALQAILSEAETGIPGEMLQRLALYLQPSGRYKLIEHAERRDYLEARRVIRMCCGGQS